MKLALLQLQPEMLAVECNLDHALSRMREVRADLYLLPELYPCGYTFLSSAEVARTAEPAASGASFEAFSGFARDTGATVVYGFAERLGDRYFNSANVVGPGGLLATYRKIHLFGREKLFFAPGRDPAPVLDLPFGRIGVMICFDWYFPEVARSLALRGAELLLQPANLVLPHCPNAMITRSLENRVFSATCDRVGVEDRGGGISHRFIGMSQVVSPRGELLVRCSETGEETSIVEIELAQARSKQVGEHNDLFADRHTPAYTGLAARLCP